MHDHAIALLLILVGFSTIPLAALLAYIEARADRSKLPGSLRGDDPSLPFEEAS